MRTRFIYRNHRGEVAEREVEVIDLSYETLPRPEYGYQPGWFLRCRDYTGGREGVIRSFALTNIIIPEGFFMNPSFNRPFKLVLS